MAASQSSQPTSSVNVILCSLCGFRGLSFYQVSRHLRLHDGASFRCGVEDCPSMYTNLSSFRNHLSDIHDDIYPVISAQLPQLVNSAFCYEFDSSNNPLSVPDSPISGNQFTPDLPVFEPPSPFSVDREDENLEQNTNRFVEILLTQGCSHSVPFQHIKNISSALINYFSNLSRDNAFSSDLEYQLQHVIRNPDIFNRYIESNFGAVFHKMINISNSNDFFAFMPFKKSIYKLLSLFSSFDEIFTGTANTDQFLYSMPHEQVDDENIIHINIFIDDFQLCNPLLAKKSQENSMTGIYYRIVSSNKFKFSGHNFIHLLALCHSSTFKAHSEIILQYISHRVNKFIDRQFPVTIGQQTHYCKIKLGFFSLDSKAASFLLGLKQSFNHRYCCRFCIEPRENFPHTFCEVSEIRDQSRYQRDLQEIHGLNDGEDCYGLQRLSPLRHFSSPNFFELCPPCIGHDIFEGICGKVFDFSLRYFISKRFLTYGSFIHNVKSFNFIGKDREYFPKVDFDSPTKVRFTINEGYTFFRFYKLFLKNVPLGDPVLILVSLAVDVINLVMCFKFEIDNINLLANTIHDFLQACSEFSGEGQISMSIKFHHLIHLPRQILKFGPPRFFSTLNFEQHNHFLKQLMLTSNNWINPPETICVKYAQEKCIVSENAPVETNKVEFHGTLPPEISALCQSPESAFALTSLKINGVKYKCFTSALFLGQDSFGSLRFLAIEKIFNINSDFFLYGQAYEGVYSDYNQIILHNLNSKSALKYSSIDCNFSSYNLYKEGSTLYIVPYYWL